MMHKAFLVPPSFDSPTTKTIRRIIVMSLVVISALSGCGLLPRKVAINDPQAPLVLAV